MLVRGLLNYKDISFSIKTPHTKKTKTAAVDPSI